MLNNTSVANEYLKKNQLHNTEFGILILSVLIMQDVSFSPILSSLRFLDKPSVDFWQDVVISISTPIGYMADFQSDKIQELKIPFEKSIKNDHDLQLFIGLSICFILAIH